MQALSDDQQINRLEKKVDGLETKIDVKVDHLEARIENVRGEARADFRLLLGVQLTTLAAMILGFAGIILQQFLS